MKLKINSPNSPPKGRLILCLKFPAAIFLTPSNNSLMGRVIVKALKTAPRITIAQIATNTAMVTSRVKLEELTTVALGLMPMDKNPNLLP